MGHRERHCSQGGVAQNRAQNGGAAITEQAVQAEQEALRGLCGHRGELCLHSQPNKLRLWDTDTGTRVALRMGSEQAQNRLRTRLKTRALSGASQPGAHHRVCSPCRQAA